jgi:ribonuclease Z
VEGLDVLIHEATYTEAVAAKVGAVPMHSSAAQVARFAHVHAIPNLVLTHFSPRHHARSEMRALEAEARQNYEGTLVLAEDGHTWTLAGDGRLRQTDP